MKTYNYIALNVRGEEVTGSVESNNESEVISELRKSGLYPTYVHNKTPNVKEKTKQFEFSITDKSFKWVFIILAIIIGIFFSPIISFLILFAMLCDSGYLK